MVPAERDLFWEMENQTAIRRGPWKLVLNGQLVEGATADTAVHFSNLDEDMSEKVNLNKSQDKIAAQMKTTAENWRKGIEERWQKEFSPEDQGTVTFPSST
jgi:arylsulfatase A-like enzyme